MAYGSWHWSLVNVFARLVGMVFGLVSLGFAFDVVVSLISSEPLRGVPSDPVTGAYVSLFASVVAGVIAVCLLTVRAYRPDLGDRTWSLGRHETRPGNEFPERRSWWTGGFRDGF